MLSAKSGAIVLIVSLAFTGSSWGFDQVSGAFVQDSLAKGATVEITFRGAVYEDGIDLLSSKPVDLPKEDKRVYEFLQKVRTANISGNLPDLLAVWDEAERKGIAEAASDSELLKKNMITYMAMQSMLVKTVVDYGNYYVALVEQQLSSGTFVMKYPMVKRKDGLYLSNKLNGDPFFDYVIDQLVPEKFTVAKPKR